MGRPGLRGLSNLINGAARPRKMLAKHMGIDLGRLDIAMPQQFLHGPNIRAGKQHLRRKRVAKRMAGDPFMIDARFPNGHLQKFSDDTVIKMMAAQFAGDGMRRGL